MPVSCVVELIRSCRSAGAVIDSERCLTQTRALSARIGEDALRSPALHGPPDGGDVCFDGHLGCDDLVVRLPQFHRLVIPGARR